MNFNSASFQLKATAEETKATNEVADTAGDTFFDSLLLEVKMLIKFVSLIPLVIW